MKPNQKAIHFFDIDNTLWNLKSKIWIIDKENPANPIMRLDFSEFNKISNGLYLKDNLVIEYNEDKYYISNELFNSIQRKKKLPIERLGLSWIEFIDKKYLDNTNVDFMMHNIEHLKGKDVYVALLTDRAYRDRNANLLNNLRLKIKEVTGLDLYKIYFVSDTLLSRTTEKIAIKKSHILLEHLVGLKIENNSFINIRQDWFSDVHFYDDELINIDYANDIQEMFNIIMKNTNDETFKYINDKITNQNLQLFNHQISNNLSNLFDTTVINLKSPMKFPIVEKLKRYDNFI